MKRKFVAVLAIAALLVSPAALASSKYNPSGGGGGGGGAVSSVSAAPGGCVSISPTTGAVVVTSSNCLKGSNNLSDVGNASTARSNLGLGTAATQSTGAFAQVANNLSDLASAATARTNLGLGTAATQSTSTFAQASNNLSDLSNAATARSNLGANSATNLSTGTLAAARIADGSLALAKLTGVDKRLGALIRAQALASSAAFDTIVGSDFGSSAEFTTTLSTGGTAPMSLTHKGGVVRQIVTTTQFSQSTTRAPGAASAVPPSLVANARTNPWYMVARVNLGTTSIQSGNTLQVQFLGSSGGTVFGFGARGNDSTTNFAYRIINQAGTNVATTATAVALDASWHTVEMVNDTTNFTIYLDGVSMYTVASSSIGTDPCGWTVTAVNNTAGSVGAAELDVDYLYVVTTSN